MKASSPVPRTVDEYIAACPPRVRPILRKIRAAIRKAAPDAEETIKYGMPTYVQGGNLIHFAAFKNHIGLYPAPRAIDRFEARLATYERSKGALRLPLDDPPLGLIAAIVKFRVAETARKNATKKRLRARPRSGSNT